MCGAAPCGRRSSAFAVNHEDATHKGWRYIGAIRRDLFNGTLGASGVPRICLG